MKKYNFLYLSNSLLLLAFLFFSGLFFAKAFLIPFSFALLIAMLMLPINKWLEKKGLKRSLSIIICILILIFTLAVIIFVFSLQVAGFAQDLPELKLQLETKFDHFQGFIESQANISPEKQISFLKTRFLAFSDSADVFAKNFLLTTTGTIFDLALIAVYIFFFMYYRERFQTFILKIAPEQNHKKVNEAMDDISLVTQKYLSGVIIVILILAVLNSVGLLIVGVKHAIFFGCLAAFLNIIPYVGVLLGSIFPIIMVLLTKDSLWAVVAVAGVLTFNQMIENNLLTPNIVGSKVKLNPLAVIISLIIGGLLWGVAGMILFIPFLGIVKIIFDMVEPMKPYGYLIGENENTERPFIKKMKGWFRK